MKRNTVSLFGVHRIRSGRARKCVMCLLLFSAGKVLEVALVEERIVELEKPRMLIWTSKDSSVSFIICVFYQYFSVTNLGLRSEARPA